MRKYLLILSLAFALASQTHAQSLRTDDCSTAMRLDDMRQAVEYLASQELGGRYPGTRGDTLASKFIVGKLHSLKLKPIVRGKKKVGFYHNFTYGKTEKRTTHNIIAVLPGTDKQLGNEYIVVGSHYDHLGMGGKDSGSRRPDTLGVHPGADDNASGDAVVLELAKYFKKVRSPRSIIFAFFGAEEQGLVGSKFFLDWMKHADRQRINLPGDLKRIVAGMKREMQAYLAGGGTVDGYLAELEKRQKLEVSYRERAEKRLEEMLAAANTQPEGRDRRDPSDGLKEAYAYWLKANAQLQAMGIYPLALPDLLRTYQMSLDIDE